MTIRQVATLEGTEHPSHSRFSGFFSKQAPIGHPCLSRLPASLLPSQARAHGEGRRGSRQKGAGHAPLGAFPEDTPPSSSPAVQFAPLPWATCGALPRGTIPPLLYITHITAFLTHSTTRRYPDPEGVPQKKGGGSYTLTSMETHSGRDPFNQFFWARIDITTGAHLRGSRGKGLMNNVTRPFFLWGPKMDHQH